MIDNFPRIKHFDILSLDRPGIDSITYKIDYSHLIDFEVDNIQSYLFLNK